MAAQNDEARLAVTQFVERVNTVEVDLKLTAGIGGKAVEDDLPEAVVVQVDVAERLLHAVMVALTEVVVHRDIALVGKQHVEGDDKDGHAEVHKPQVQVLERPYQRAVHPRHALSAAAPRLMLQLFHCSLRYYSVPC